MIHKRGISDEQFALVAKELRCDEAAIRAVAEVESAGSGFLENGEPRVLFEGHIFHRLTNGKYDKSHPDICHPCWDRARYAKGPTADIRGLGELERLKRASALDEDAALRSASIGRFQILGDNCEECGWLNVKDFWQAMCEDEYMHLAAFANLVATFNLEGALRAHNWKVFARVWNGPRYAENKYDIKMAQAYTNHEIIIAARNKNNLTESTA
jgi:hypothetical protein